MIHTNANSADGPFLGFLFQIERVMLWLSEGGEGKIVGIETDDDVVVQVKNGADINKIYEQAKNAQGDNIPFQNQSEDLWKTLSIWINAVKGGRIDVKNAVFSAITNKKLPNNRLLLKLSSASKNDKEGMKAVIIELKNTATKLSKKNKKYGDVLLQYEDEKLIEIVDRITVLDGTFHHDQKDFKSKFKANLSMSNTLPFDHIYKALLGAVTDKIIQCWRNHEEAWIDVELFNNLYSDLIAQYKKKSFIEKATDFLPVDKREVEQNRKNIYVEQLKLIDCDEREILEAIHDYLRANSEKSRYAREFEITEPKFLEYYDDLQNHWTLISRPRFKINPQKLTLNEVGYQVYYETILYKGKLNNHEPEQSYTYKGAYHHLANQSKIGWHPTWEKFFKQE